MFGHYVLEDDGSVREVDLLEWGRFFTEPSNLRVDLTEVRWTDHTGTHSATVSTVFLGLDHGFGGGKPVLFETMIFFPDFMKADEWQTRYCTKEEAVAGHEVAVKEAQLIIERYYDEQREKLLERGVTCSQEQQATGEVQST